MRRLGVNVLSAWCIAVSLFNHQWSLVQADAEDHVYKPADPVDVWYNKIGPYNNPQETYTYESMPFCKADVLVDATQTRGKKNQGIRPKSHALGIGEILEGNELYNSGHIVKFQADTPRTVMCRQTLTEDDVKRFKFAVLHHYWYQLYIDDLPLWGLVGKIVEKEDDPDILAQYPVGTYLLFTHKQYSISFNGPHIIHVNLTYADAFVEIKTGQEVSFTYEVLWKETHIDYHDRFNRYLEDDFFKHQIHWFSIFNSFMMVIFLCGLVAFILVRTLKNDYARYAQDDDELGIERSLRDETGWKQIHGDVFRKPMNLPWYAALIGTGVQLLVLAFSIIVITIVWSLYEDPGEILSTSITCYAISTFVSGFISGSTYYQYFYPNPSPSWIFTMLLSVSLFPGIVFFVSFGMNAVAVYYGTTYAIPFLTMLKIFLLWAFVSFPLSILGTVLGRHWNGKSSFPCRVNKFPRPIPYAHSPFSSSTSSLSSSLSASSSTLSSASSSTLMFSRCTRCFASMRWTSPAVLVALSGILPFGSIFIEMYFVLTSFWNYKFYFVYGFMLLVLVILCIVSVCVTIVSVYCLLNQENYHWRWFSFFASGSTALYVYLYIVYFFMFKTHMTGFLQFTFYFGYMTLFCIALFIMCGTIGALGSDVFVKRIYRNIKSE